MTAHRYRLENFVCDCVHMEEVATGKAEPDIYCPYCKGSGYDGYRISEQDLKQVIKVLQYYVNRDPAPWNEEMESLAENTLPILIDEEDEK